MRQRVAIATAFINKPDLVIADEPTTALDVTIQAQILALLKQLQSEFHMAMLLITHDLGIVRKMADVIGAPLHPYTRGLIGSVPSANARGTRLAQIPGMTPSLINLAPGCRFRARCPRADAECTSEPAISEPLARRKVRCWRPHLEGAMP